VFRSGSGLIKLQLQLLAPSAVLGDDQDLHHVALHVQQQPPRSMAEMALEGW
jgi:hypothetical protein